ncbi:MAG: hypothetical protein A2W03_04430 [Candidatus Aminicenantes bacterium RBG_16_63_16]|nr:MAG: hypothetical protein A2W03_04430 [Candidatus Aminicenantes bacterium RBG_16_63_16]
MALVLRGEIRWADLSPGRGHEQAGRRPVLVLSHDIFSERSETAIVMAITSRPQQAGFPLTQEIRAAGLPKRSWVKMTSWALPANSTWSLSRRKLRNRASTSSLLLEGA